MADDDNKLIPLGEQLGLLDRQLREAGARHHQPPVGAGVSHVVTLLIGPPLEGDASLRADDGLYAPGSQTLAQTIDGAPDLGGALADGLAPAEALVVLFQLRIARHGGVS